MTVKKWIVECDQCGVEIDALKEPFFETKYGQLCASCHEKEEEIENDENDSEIKSFDIVLEGTLKGFQKIKAINIDEALKKSVETEIIMHDNEPKWRIISIERSFILR